MSSKGPRILFVDDDQQVLAAYARTFRKGYAVDTALGPVEGLAAIAERGPFAVVISDLRMPGIDGIEFFSQLKNRCPDTIRIMLTGYADIGAAISAVNKGHVFRFLAKPCPEQEMHDALAAGVRQYRLVTAEKEFIRGTLKGVIKVLTDLLAMANATAHQRCSRVKRLVLDLGRALGMNEPWKLELAVMLSQLGFLILPEALLQKYIQGDELDTEERELFALHPRLGSELLTNIPRMEEVATIIAWQEKGYDGSGPPDQELTGKEIPLGARILKVALDFDALQQRGLSRRKALQAMRARNEWYDPAIFSLMEPLLGAREGYAREKLPVDELAPGMVLEKELAAGVPTPGKPLKEQDVAAIKALGLESKLLEVFVPLLEPSILDEIDPSLMVRIQRLRQRLGSNGLKP